MAKKKADGYQVIAKETRKLPHTLSDEERLKLRERENELGEKVLALEREHEAVRTTEKEEARARREAIKDARSAWSEAIDARRTGVSQVERKVEVRAGFVRVDVPELVCDGQTVDGFSKLIGPGSIYAMTPVSEAVARAVAMQLRERPVHPWEMPRVALPAPARDDLDDPPTCRVCDHVCYGNTCSACGCEQE